VVIIRPTDGLLYSFTGLPVRGPLPPLSKSTSKAWSSAELKNCPRYFTNPLNFTGLRSAKLGLDFRPVLRFTNRARSSKFGTVPSTCPLAVQHTCPFIPSRKTGRENWSIRITQSCISQPCTAQFRFSWNLIGDLANAKIVTIEFNANLDLLRSPHFITFKECRKVPWSERKWQKNLVIILFLSVITSSF